MVDITIKRSPMQRDRFYMIGITPEGTAWIKENVQSDADTISCEFQSEYQHEIRRAGLTWETE